MQRPLIESIVSAIFSVLLIALCLFMPKLGLIVFVIAVLIQCVVYLWITDDPYAWIGTLILFLSWVLMVYVVFRYFKSHQSIHILNNEENYVVMILSIVLYFIFGAFWTGSVLYRGQIEAKDGDNGDNGNNGDNGDESKENDDGDNKDNGNNGDQQDKDKGKDESKVNGGGQSGNNGNIIGGGGIQLVSWRCRYCGKEFPPEQKQVLDAHTAVCHKAHEAKKKKLYPFVCNLCGKKFTQKAEASYKKHMDGKVCQITSPQDQDEQKEVYWCPNCPMGFQNKQELTTHQNICTKGSILIPKRSENRPTGTKMFCRDCDDSFETVSQLKAHYQSQHRSPKTKPNEPTQPLDESRSNKVGCLYCDESFDTQDQLNDHVRKCKEAQAAKSFSWGCPVCKKRFKLVRDLAEHKLKMHPKRVN